MSSPYRLKWDPQTNLARDTRVDGAVALAAGGAVSYVRPSSSVNNQPNAGAGYMFNVTAQAGTNATYNVAFVEQYFKPVGFTASFNPPFVAGTQTVADVQCQCSAYDPTTNSFNVTLTDHTGAALLLSAVPAGNLVFEARFINTVSPSTL